MAGKVVSAASLPALSPIVGKPIVACFDGGLQSHDGGLLAVWEIEQRSAWPSCGWLHRRPACAGPDHPPPRRDRRSRMLMILAGYEDN
jgi:hypothetical protein